MKWFRLLLAVFLMLAIVLFGSPLVYANGGDEGKGAIIDISLSGDPNGDTGGICKISARREGSEINTMMFFSPDGVVYRDGDEATSHTVIQVSNESHAVIDIGINADLAIDIDVSGACEVNVRVEGPWEVHIDAGDEVRLNVDASDESQVFVDDEKVNDNPGDAPDDPNVEASDASPFLVSDHNLNGAPGDDLDNPSLIDDDTSRLNSLAIISGAFLGAGLLAFFLIRRRAQNKVNNEGR